ncbi:primosomal protein N' [Candidatus Aminicenantes bacterium AC-335-G13]|nr:primosomal protein N' [Candidatus Aminicenantes bacterium AC-335-G13]
MFRGGEFIKLTLPSSLILKTTKKVFLTEKAKNKKNTQNLSKNEKALLNFIGNKSYSVTFLKRKFKDISPILSKLSRKGLIEIKNEFRKIKKRKGAKPLEEGFYQLKLETFIHSKEKDKIDEIIKSIKDEKSSQFLIFAPDNIRVNLYSYLIKETISKGKKVLLILPEILLVRTIYDELKKRINVKIGMFHSGLTPRERETEWFNIRNNMYDLIIGSRSSIFFPIENLGLIIVDKEEDESYFLKKDYPFYDLKQIAKFRAKIESVTLVYGSESPSIESYYEALKRGGLISLIREKRYGMKVVINYHSKKETKIIGEELKKEIKERLRKNEQVILFVNRKGEEEFLICKKCGLLLKCKNCNYPYNIYKRDKIVCYFCNYILPLPSNCPICKGVFKRIIGKGTGSVLKEIQNLFPGIKACRFDSEAIKNRKTETKVINDFNKGKVKILIGTQLLTYYYNFNKVSLLGVLYPENIFGISDYKSGERFFQIMTNLKKFVSEKGTIFIQTSFPENYIIQILKDFNYIKFYKSELKFRELFEYPPFFKIGELIFYGKNLRNIANKARVFYSKIRESSEDLKIYEPVLLPKIHGECRVRILIKAKEERIIVDNVKKALQENFQRNFNFIIYA